MAPSHMKSSKNNVFIDKFPDIDIQLFCYFPDYQNVRDFHFCFPLLLRAMQKKQLISLVNPLNASVALI